MSVRPPPARQRLGRFAQWHPDSPRFLGWEYGYGTVGFDVETNRRLGILFPWLTGDHYLYLSPVLFFEATRGRALVFPGSRAFG